MTMVTFKREYKDVILDLSKRRTHRKGAKDWLKKAGHPEEVLYYPDNSPLGRTGVLPNRRMFLKDGKTGHHLDIWLGSPRGKYAHGLKLWIRKLGISTNTWKIELCKGWAFTIQDAKADGFETLEEMLEALGKLDKMDPKDVLDWTWAIIMWEWWKGPYRDWRKTIILTTVKKAEPGHAEFDDLYLALDTELPCTRSEFDELFNQLLEEEKIYEPCLGQVRLQNQVKLPIEY